MQAAADRGRLAGSLRPCYVPTPELSAIALSGLQVHVLEHPCSCYVMGTRPVQPNQIPPFPGSQSTLNLGQNSHTLSPPHTSLYFIEITPIIMGV